MSNLYGGGFARGQQVSDDRFPDPFCDIASLSMPETIIDSLRWSEYIMQAQGLYREAINRVVSYFLTDVKIDDLDSANKRVGKEERDKFETFLNDTLGIKVVLHSIAMDYLCYGNSFTSIIMPFRRYLHCPREGCGFEAPLKQIATNKQFGYRWSEFEFSATCPMCNYRGNWKRVDRRSEQEDEIRIKRWSPHEIDLLFDPYSEACSYIWRIPDDYRNMIREGHLHHLEHAPWEVVEAIKHNENLKFHKDVIYHMKEDAPAGIRLRGWGMSRIIINFRQVYYLVMLLRLNEAIALDFTIPFRVITPSARPGGATGASTDPAYGANLGSFRANIMSMLRARRRDPARWNVVPYPIEYQALGGEASQLAPKDLIEQAIEMLLTAIGVPIELFKGSLSMQAAPASLRLFEANWAHLPHKLNRFLAKLVIKVSELMSWEPVTAKLERVTVADDLNRQMAKLQLMMGQQISKTTGLQAVGADFEAETKRLMEEQKITAEAQQKMQEEMQQAAQQAELAAPGPMMTGVGATGAGAGQPAPAGDPSGGGGGGGGGGAPQPGAPQPSAVDQFIAQRQQQPNVARSPDDMEAQAQTIATDLMSKPESQRRSDLIRLKQADETMHSLVRAVIDKINQDARSQGQQQVLQQNFPKQSAQAQYLTF